MVGSRANLNFDDKRADSQWSGTQHYVSRHPFYPAASKAPFLPMQQRQNQESSSEQEKEIIGTRVEHRQGNRDYYDYVGEVEEGWCQILCKNSSYLCVYLNIISRPPSTATTTTVIHWDKHCGIMCAIIAVIILQPPTLLFLPFRSSEAKVVKVKSFYEVFLVIFNTATLVAVLLLLLCLLVCPPLQTSPLHDDETATLDVYVHRHHPIKGSRVIMPLNEFYASFFLLFFIILLLLLPFLLLPL